MDETRAPFKVGTKYTRVKGGYAGRRYRVTFVNMKPVNKTPLFCAEPIDGNWAHDGGTFPFAHEVEIDQ
jgi:hypothetical protein